MNTILTRLGTCVPPSVEFRVFWGVAIIIACVFVVYLPAINGRFILDDDKLVTDNQLVRAPDGLSHIWCTSEALDFWPATNSTFWVEWRLWKMDPAGYHVTNLILHVAEALLVWLILRKLSIPGAYLAAVIFAVHPVNVESVAWIASRKGLTAMLFLLISILWYLKAVTSAGVGSLSRARSHGGPWERGFFSSFILHPSSFHFWYWLSLAAFVLAMLGKGSVVVMPALILVIMWWMGPVTKRDLMRLLPFFTVAAALAAINMWFQTHGSGEAFRSAGIAERVLGAGSALWFYLYKAVLPVDLTFVYPMWHIEVADPRWWLPLLAAVAFAAVLLVIGKVRCRPILFAGGFFCVALFPVIGFSDVGFMKYSLVADRYQHIAIIAVIALAAAGWSGWRKRMGGAACWAAAAVAIAAPGALGLLTWRQSRIYSDEITLYRATLEKNQDCWMVHNNLGIALDDAGQTQEAIAHYERALQINPNFSKAYNNLGIILAQHGRVDEAIKNYRQALRFVPDDYEIYNNLGAVLLKAGRTRDAIEIYKLAIKLKPDFPEVCYNLGNAYKAAGQYQDAIEQYKIAIHFNPDLSDAHNNLGVSLVQAGRPREAIDQYLDALRLKPDYPQARNNLGLALSQLGKVDEAIGHYKEALQLKPDYPDAHYNLGNALLQANRLGEAIDHYGRALELVPDNAEAHNNLGLALLRSGRPLEAVPHYQEALRLKPDYLIARCNLVYAYAQTDQPSKAVAAAQAALELARSQGQTALAKQLEDWLKSYSGNAPGAVETPHSGDVGPGQAP